MHSHISVFWDFWWISVIPSFSFWLKGSKRKPGNHGKSLSLGLQSSNTVDLFFDHYFNVLSAKTKTTKSNSINLDGLETLKRQICGTWFGIRLNHFEIYVIWRISQLFLKLYSHILVLWLLSRISVIYEFFLLDIGLKKRKPGYQGKSLFFSFFFSNVYQIHFCVCLSLLLAEFVIPLLNCFFHDFRNFRDFRVFDLANIRLEKLAVAPIWFPILYFCFQFFYAFVFLNFRGNHISEFCSKEWRWIETMGTWVHSS